MAAAKPVPVPDFLETSRKGVADADLRRKLENSTGRHLDHVAHMRAEFPEYDGERGGSERPCAKATNFAQARIKATPGATNQIGLGMPSKDTGPRSA
jgi:hypothetical protein